jgi:hypothetical protein
MGAFPFLKLYIQKYTRLTDIWEKRNNTDNDNKNPESVVRLHP